MQNTATVGSDMGLNTIVVVGGTRLEMHQVTPALREMTRGLGQ
jgi:serine acetyltransferase